MNATAGNQLETAEIVSCHMIAERVSQTQLEHCPKGLQMVPAPNHIIAGDNMVGSTTATGRSGKSNDNPISSWLSGLGLGAGSPGSPRRFGLSSPSSPRGASAIADDIRNDQDLFFADDLPSCPPPLSMPPAAGGCRSILPQRRPSSATTTTSVGLPRRSSQQKMKNLQREVDLALEYFSQETENELDHFDGDDYLNNRLDKYPRVEGKVQFGRLSGSDGDDSLPGTAATSMATSVVTDYETDDCHTKLLSLAGQSMSPMSEPQTPRMTGGAGGLSLKHKTKSIIQLPLSLLPSQAAMNCSTEDDDASSTFENTISEELNKICLDENRNFAVDFNSNSSLRNAMEPFLAVARLQREAARQNVFDTLDEIVMPQEPQECANRSASRRSSTCSEFSFHIGSTYGVPYPALRNESSFLYDVDSFPLSEVLAETLGVDDLSKLHIDNPLVKDKGRLMAPLHNRGKRRKFHQCFDSFVTSQVIPLLHSQALAKGVFYTNRHQLQKGKPQSIIYRYQAFPSINIVRPGECSTDPHCDMAQGHSIGNINFHIPLTAAFGTNAVYTESRPGREDWHPLVTKSPGLGFQFDGARCLHFNPKNETDITRVSLNFRIAITRAHDRYNGDIAYDPDDQLCCHELLKDKFSLDNPGFYDEVVVNVGDVPRSFMPGPVAIKRKGGISVVG